MHVLSNKQLTLYRYPLHTVIIANVALYWSLNKHEYVFWYTQSSNLKSFICRRETLLVDLIDYTLGCNVYVIKFVISSTSLFG